MRLQPAEVFQTTLTAAAGLSGAADTATKFVNMVDRLSPGFAACGIGLALASPGVPIAIGAVLTTLNLWQQSRQNQEAAELRSAIDTILQELRARSDAKELDPAHLETAIRAMLTEQNDLLVQGFREDLAASTAGIADLHAEVQTLLTSLEAFQAQYTLEVQKESGARLDLELPKAKLDAQGYLYYQAATRLTGREDDLTNLRNLLASEHPFLFFIVSGPGGVGKSRLAWELCWRMRRQGWEAGFVKSLTEDNFNWGAWRPERDTLLVVDYIFAKDKNLWRKILEKLAARDGGKRLRILVLERTSDASSWDWLVGEGELSRHYGPADAEQPWRGRDEATCKLKLETYEVKGLGQAGIEAIFWDYKVPDSVARADRYLKEIDPIGRPLFAMLAARSLNELGAGFQWSLGALMDHVLHRLCKTWRDAGVDTPHLRLLVLATMLGGLHPEEYGADHPLADLLPRELREDTLVQLASFSDDWDPERRWLPPLLPDPLGEAFVLAYFLGRYELFGETSEVTAKANADRLMVHAEAEGGDAYMDFKRRALQDFPASFRAFRQIESLDLSFRQVEDEGLKSLAGLTSLTTLDLGYAWVGDAGLSHLSGLTSLATLDLTATQVGDEGLAHLSGLTSLTRLDLIATQVGDEGLAHLSGLTSLTRLDLIATQVSDAGLAHLSGLTSLRSLDLLGTQVSDVGLAHLSGLTSLRSLSLKFTQINDAGLAHLSGLTSLTTLDLTGTQVGDAGLAHLSRLTSLTTLGMKGTQVGNAGLAHLAGLTSLTTLDLEGTQVGNAGLAHLAGLTSLTKLDLMNTQVSDGGLAHLAGLTSLTTLDLSYNQVGDAGLAHLPELTSLTILDLRNTQVGDAGLAHLAGLASLTMLDLRNTQVGDAGLAHLAGLASLRWLDLRETQVTPERVEWLQAKLPSCWISFGAPN